MSLRVRDLKASLSLLLAVTVTSLFTLHAFAADDPKAPASGSPDVQDCTGTLTIKSGKVLLNGNEAQTGATVMNGSVISTGDNGRVIIDLGAIGRIELGHHTTVTVDCATGSVHGRTTCGGRVRIEDRLGQVNVIVPKIETILPGKHEIYDDPAEFTAPAGSSVLVECGSRVGGLWLTGPGLTGLLALIGVSAGVVTGIIINRKDKIPVSSSVP